jgi:hypothetical protein
MQIVVTNLSPVHPNHDTISIFDSDQREIAIRRSQIPTLISNLRKYRHNPYRARKTDPTTFS